MSSHAIHSVHIAIAVATLDERARAGCRSAIGTGAPGDLADAGIEPRRSLLALAETVEIARLLLAGEPVTLLANRPARVAGAALIHADHGEPAGEIDQGVPPRTSG